MKLLDSVKLLQEELDSREAVLASREASLFVRESDVAGKLAAMAIKEKELAKLEAKIAEDEQRLHSLKSTDERIEEFKTARIEAVAAKTELGKKQNELAEMYATDKALKEEVEKRELALSKEKEEYKERLKKEFFEELQRKFPH